MNEHVTLPWYRQFWPWFLIALPAATVVAGIATLVIAATGSDDLVVDDYGRIGVLTEEKLARDRRARELGLSAVLHFDPTSGAAQLRLGGGRAAGARLRLVHPTLAARDRACTLQPAAGGRTGCRLDGLEAGSWQVVVEGADGDWRLSERIHVGTRPIRAEMSPGGT